MTVEPTPEQPPGRLSSHLLAAIHLREQAEKVAARDSDSEADRSN